MADELAIHRAMTVVVMGLAAIVFAVLFFVRAPYGRHRRGGWGPTMDTRWAWLIMESPSSLLFAAIFFSGQHHASVAPLLLFALWQYHYAYRAFVYPFRIRPEARPTPVVIAGMAFAFNLINSYINARWISHLGHYPLDWLRSPTFVLGAALFLTGRRINHWADGVLIALRERQKGYAIPYGGLYRFISCPNYLGEIIEWIGWAIATWSLAGGAFAVFAVANLAPRAWAHHRWYHETFPHYPPERKALIPLLW
ncbi:MAG: DUF1295 domain-containing protein [Myxococcota bacterium]